MLAISDKGCGMHKDTVRRVFEPFFTTKGLANGTGLALASISGAVKQNNGFIDVSSEPGHGSTFTIYLPRADAATGARQPGTGEVPPRGGTETLLVVDDEATILWLARDGLERLGYTVLTAGSPAEANRKSEDRPGPIHVLLTDVMMPRMNGWQLADRLGAARPALKCLYMPGYTADAIAHRRVLVDPDNLVSKPFALGVLAEKIREVLDRQPSPPRNAPRQGSTAANG